MTRYLHLDVAGGVAGDMLLGALVDLLGRTDAIEALPGRLGLTGVQIQWGSTTRHQLAARTVAVRVEQPPPHRTLKDVLNLVHAAALGADIESRVRRVFERLAAAEAAVHDTTRDRIHFHEVGADDAMVDIVGSCVCLQALEVSALTAGPLPMARGVAAAAHGAIPLPAPAVLELAKGWPIEWLDGEGERVTPTGAALVTTLATAAVPPPGRLIATGYGAGQRDFPDRPNLVRAILCDAVESPGDSRESITELVACLDDATGEELAYAAEILLGAGALDVYYGPLVMKKGRPGWELTVLSRPEAAGELARLAMQHTGTAGLRQRRITRRVWVRHETTVDTAFGGVRMKVFTDVDGETRAVPEFEDCRRLARASQSTLQEIQAAAVRAYQGMKEA